MPFDLRGVRVLVSGADQEPAEALHALGCEGMSEEVAAGLLGVSVKEFREELERNPEWRQAWN